MIYGTIKEFLEVVLKGYHYRRCQNDKHVPIPSKKLETKCKYCGVSMSRYPTIKELM